MKRLAKVLFLLSFLCGCDRPATKPEKHETAAQTPIQKPAVKSWRNDPLLKGRFLADYPDDLQVIVHDGGPRLTEARPELIWARVTGRQAADRFTATVLNRPRQLKSVTEGGQIQFMIKRGWDHPVQVRDRYLAERSDWIIHPCNQCSFDELFDAPSDLMAKIFPNLPKDATMDSFTSFCPLCGGVQVVQRKGSE